MFTKEWTFSLSKWMGRISLILAIGLTGWLMSGCGPKSSIYNPTFGHVRNSMHRLLLMPPEIVVLQSSPDGKMRSDQATVDRVRQNLEQALAKQIAGRGLVISKPSPEILNQPETRSIQALYASVNHSIQLHVYGAQFFPDKSSHFDYSLGSLDYLVEGTGSDGMLMVSAFQSAMQDKKSCWIVLSVLEPGGAIVWYSLQESRNEIDLESAQDVDNIVERAMDGFRS